MKAIQLTNYDGPQALRVVDVTPPFLSDDAVLIDVHAIGINYPDLLITTGQYQLKPALPFIPGSEIAGVIRQAPPQSPWNPGDRVAAFVWSGGYAETVVAPEKALMRIPDNVDFATAAATVVNYQTAFFALHRRGRLVAGETVLVLGAGGGIGTAAIQVAHGLGAHVIAGVANDAQRATALAAGADSVLVLAPGYAQQVKALKSRGVDVVVDPLGDWLFDEAVRTLAPEGRILIIGFAAGEIPHLKVNRLLLRNASAVGVAFGAFLNVEAGIMQAGAEVLSDLLERGILDPPIGERFTFDEIPRALQLLNQGKIAGKAVASVIE